MLLEQLEIHLQNNDLNSHLMPYAKINSNYIRDLNIKPRIIKLLVKKKKKERGSLCDLGLSKFLDRTPKP